jgi:hypothetical protein
VRRSLEPSAGRPSAQRPASSRTSGPRLVLSLSAALAAVAAGAILLRRRPAQIPVPPRLDVVATAEEPRERERIAA